METKQNVIELIGNTPLLKLNRIGKDLNVNIFVKLENLNPGASVKDRLALAMISHAEENGLINKDTEIIEPTSGNTGIGLAMICAVRGYKLTLTMPESMSQERRKILAAYGAKLELTPAEKGMKGAISRAEEIASSLVNAYIPYQFKNVSNVAMHRRTTAMEIWAATGGRIDIFIAGVGTGGTLTGVVSKIREMKPDLVGIAVEPALSPVLSGGEPGRHKIQGIGAGFIPEIMDMSLLNEIIRVEDEQAFAMAKSLAREEGILAGISAGANVAAALLVAGRSENAGKTIVTVICDTGERYLSSELFNGK